MEFDFSKQPGLTLYNRNLVTDGEPLVSIVTPYYNGGEYVEQTYQCVLNQTFPWFEWIIVNDGSTNTADVEFIEKLAATDPRIRVIHKENGGISTARNAGIREAKTPYVLSLDCDDLIEPTYIEYCWWMLEKNPGAAWAYTYSCGFQDQEYIWEKTFDPIRMKTENLLTATALIRKKDLEAVGCYAELAKHYNEDWYMWLRQIARGAYPVQSCGEPLMWYRRRDGGVLSIVEDRDKKEDFNAKLIKDAGREIETFTPPVLYPRRDWNYNAPKMSGWDRCVFRSHDKIHVAVLTPWLELGGADKFNLDLISGLDKGKFDVSILTTAESTNPWQQRFRQATPEVFNLTSFVEQRDFAEFISYFIRSREVDVLFVTNSYHGYYLLPWLREQFPELVIVDYVHMEEWYWRAGGYARTSGVLGAVTEKTYVCNSKTKRVLEENFCRSSDSVETVHIGVDEKLFDASLVSPGYVYKKLKISMDRPIVLFICRMHPQKRPFLMLEIAKKVSKEIPDVAFVAVGDGPHLDALRQKSGLMGLKNNVFFVGAEKEVRSYYKDAALTLICSLKEGLALTAYESCAMGVPVVSADVGGQGDLIDSTVGALIPCRQDEESIGDRDFDEEEINDYINAVVNILSDAELRAKMSRSCRERIEAAFTIDNMVKRFEHEFTRLYSDKALNASRRQKSEALRQLAPLAGDYYVMEMQAQANEDQAAFCEVYWKGRLNAKDEKKKWQRQQRRYKRIDACRRIADVFCPLGTKRREILKNFLRKRIPYFIP